VAPPAPPDPDPAAGHLRAQVVADLGGRVRHSWVIRQDGQQLVLRAHADPLSLGAAALLDSINWEAAARRNAIAAGWPAAAPIGEPFELGETWWTVEQWLDGDPAARTAAELGGLLARWHGSRISHDQLSARPGVAESVTVLADPGLDQWWARCTDPGDRSWLERRYEQALALADRLDWAASPRVLVHGDLTAWNLLWRGARLTGLLDFELATVDRRMVEFVHTWRCRHDQVVTAYHATSPLGAEEWPMLLVDWWATLLSLSAAAPRGGHQPHRWELDGLRRTSPLADQLQRAHLPAQLRSVPRR